MNTFKKNHLKSIFTILLVLFWCHSYAQLDFANPIELSTQQKLLPDSVLKKKIVPVPLNQIPAKIELAEDAIKLGEKRILPKRDIIKIDSLFPLYIDFLSVQKEKANSFVKANPNRQKIDNLINKWDGYYSQLNSWQKQINEVGDKNIDFGIPFHESEFLWTITLESAKNENAPSTIIHNIERTLENISKIKKAIIDENNYLLTLETNIITQKTIVNQTIEDFNYLINSEIYDVFYKRHEALWNSSFTTFKLTKQELNERDYNDSFSIIFSNIGNYFNDNKNSIYTYLFLVLSLVILILYLKKAFLRIQFTDPVPILQRSKEIIVDHTFSSIIFVSSVVSLFLFDSLPFLLFDILLLITLLSSTSITKTIIYKRFNNSLYYIVLFFFLDSIKTFIWFSSTYYRIYVLIEAILVIVVIYHFTRPYFETRKKNNSSVGWFLINLIPVLYFLLFVSIISNLFGYTNLSDLSIKITIQSSAVTLLFFSLFMVINGIVLGILHLFFSSQKDFDPDRKILIERRAIDFIRFIIFIWWFIIFLKMVDLRESLFGWIQENTNVVYHFGTVSFTLTEIFTFVVVLFISFITSNFISMIVDSGSLDFIKLPKGIPAAISMVLRYFIIAFGFVLSLSALGIDLGQFSVLAGALGVGIGFGLQTIISNFVSGIILVFERPVLPGDAVEIQNLLGVVTKIGVRASKVQTYDGAEVIVPNNNLLANDLINWTLSDNKKRIEIKIGAAYGSDPNVILKLLIEEALKNEFTIHNPAPIAVFDQFGDSSLNFRLLVWVPFENGLISKSNISVGIYNSFKENGIEIPFPQRDIHIKDTPKKDQD